MPVFLLPSSIIYANTTLIRDHLGSGLHISAMCLKICIDRSYVVWVLIVYFVLFCYGVEASDNHKSKNLQSNIPTDQPYRTAYHFQPPRNWMNDPNGPMYYNGVYHLFYQYNPYAAIWGNITWAHSISYDLINWVHLNDALSPTDSFDINGCWSGSTTILPGGIPAILYTGGDLNNSQVQNLAMPKNLSDPLLQEWVKSPLNPLMSPVDGIDPKQFRDPTTAWMGPDGLWRAVVGSQINSHGTALLYRSKDFLNWIRSNNPLHYSNKTGMWECPDFYPVSISGKDGLDSSYTSNGTTRHVLKASFSSHDYYIIGNYDHKTDKYTVETDFMDSGAQFRYDYGRFYASKSFYDNAKKRRVLWAWINEADSQADDVQKGWSSLQSIPRSISLSETGRQLVQWPVKELEKLRSKQVNLKKKVLKGGSVFEIMGITASQADIEVSFSLSNFIEPEWINQTLVDPQMLCTQKNATTRESFGPFGLLILASKDLTEQTAIFFRVFKGYGKYVVLMCSDQSRSSVRAEVDKTSYGAFVDIDPQRESISLRSLIDHSIVESFGGEGRTCMTARVYPKLAIDKEAKLYAFNNGTQSVTITTLRAWSMKKAQIVPIGN